MILPWLLRHKSTKSASSLYNMANVFGIKRQVEDRAESYRGHGRVLQLSGMPTTLTAHGVDPDEAAESENPPE